MGTLEGWTLCRKRQAVGFSLQVTLKLKMSGKSLEVSLSTAGCTVGVTGRLSKAGVVC